MFSIECVTKLGFLILHFLFKVNVGDLCVWRGVPVASRWSSGWCCVDNAASLALERMQDAVTPFHS